MKRVLSEHIQRYGREFRRRNGDIREQVAEVLQQLDKVEEIDADFVRQHQLITLLLHGCYTKQVPTVSASLQTFFFLANNRLLVNADLQLMVQVLFELTNNNMFLSEIGATALECCLNFPSLTGSSLGKAIGICIRQHCSLSALHQIISLVIDRTDKGLNEEKITEDDLFSISLSLESQPPAHAMAPTHVDAFALLQDLSLLSLRGRRPRWLQKVRRVPHLMCLDVLAYTLTHRPYIFQQNVYFESLLSLKIFDLLTICLENVMTGNERQYDEYIDKAHEAATYRKFWNDSDSETDSGGENQVDINPTVQVSPDAIYLRLVVITERLVRNLAHIDKFRDDCSKLLEGMLRSLPKVTINMKTMMLMAWANLLTSCCASWKTEAFESVFLPPYLIDILSWLFRQSTEIQLRREEMNGADANIAFRRNGAVAQIRVVNMATGIPWKSPEQTIHFDNADYLYVHLMATKNFIISLQSYCYKSGNSKLSEILRNLQSVACAGTTGILTKLVPHCVDYQTDQILTLMLETTFVLSGDAGHQDLCTTIVKIHTDVINYCLNHVPSDSDLRYRLAHYGVSLLHLASNNSVFIGDQWPSMCEVIFKLSGKFKFPNFSSIEEHDASCVASEEKIDVRRDLENHINRLCRNSTQFSPEVLLRLLNAYFSNLQEKVAGVASKSAEEFNRLVHFTIGKVSELAIININRFYLFSKAWLESFINVFFLSLSIDVPAAREYFYHIVDRLIVAMDVESEEAEEALLWAFHQLELTDSQDVMRLQINCLQRLVERYEQLSPKPCHFNSLRAIPKLLMRHCSLPDSDNISAAFDVFQNFLKSPASSHPDVVQQCCEKSLHLCLAFLSQNVSPNTANTSPNAMRGVYKIIRKASLDLDPTFEVLIMQHVQKFEAYCRDKRPAVRREVNFLFFDVLQGEEIRSSDTLFFGLIESVVTPGLSLLVDDLKREPDEDQIEMYSSYILNVINTASKRYVESGQKQRQSLIPCRLWSQLLEALCAILELNLDPVTFAVLQSMKMLCERVSAVETDDIDDDLRALRRLIWWQSLRLCSRAAEDQISEVLLPDTIHLLEQVFVAEFSTFNGPDLTVFCDITYKLIKTRAFAVETDLVARKARHFLALVNTIIQKLLATFLPENEEIACSLLLRLASLSLDNIKDEEQKTPIWPLPHFQIYERTVFSMMQEITTDRIENENRTDRQVVWLQRCLHICVKVFLYQYSCVNISNWRAVYNCFRLAIDLLLRPNLLKNECERATELANEYKKAIEVYLFTMDIKSSRFMSTSDFLEHQTNEIEILNKLQDFVTISHWQTHGKGQGDVVGARQIVHMHLTKYFIDRVIQTAQTPTPDEVLCSCETGSLSSSEFCDNRHWRLQAACIKTLTSFLSWSLNQPDFVTIDSELDILNQFCEYAKGILVGFKERHETRGDEPLPSVFYFQMNCILTTLKNMLDVAHIDTKRRQVATYLYPYMVDVILLCRDGLLVQLLDVLHGYKAIMYPGDTTA